MAKQSLISLFFKINVMECEYVKYSAMGFSMYCFPFFLITYLHSVQGYIYVCIWLFFIQLAKAFCDPESHSCEKGST